MINKLYEASRAGVDVRLIVRGICCLIPDVEQMSENIQAISILDRFLEHARVYIFANDGDEKMFIASADWMTRNLDRRVEVGAPIYDPELYTELRRIIDIQWRDNMKAREINKTFSNPYRRSLPTAPPVRAQLATYRYIEKLLTTKTASE